MKVLLTLALLALIATMQTQDSTPTSSDLIVLKFSWSKYVSGGMIRPVEADPAPGPIVIDRTPDRDPNYQRPAANPVERHAELAVMERDAALSTDRRVNFYVYRLQIKNAGTKPIKSFVWASEDPAATTASPAREFFCSVKTKPNESKAVETLSTLAPSPVVVAGKTGDKKEKSPSISAVINRIDYADGSTWERPGRDSSTLSPNAQPKVDSGKCVRL